MKYILLLGSLLFATEKSIAGVWGEKESSALKNTYAVFSQKGDSVFMAHYLEFNGQAFFEQGKGIRIGDTLKYHVKVIQKIPGWSTAGDHLLVLQADGSLKGTYSDNLGNTGPLELYRK